MAESKRLILLTGASSGIGRCAALQFAARGDRVLAVARSRERLDTLAAEAEPGRIIPYVADVSDAASMDQLAQTIRRDHRVPDVVIANAGIGLDARFSETKDDALRSVLEVNVVGVYRTLRPWIEEMVRRRAGRLLVISSIVGKRGVPHYSAYSASKFALDGMGDALRSELYGSGVSLGIICPSSTETEFQKRLLREGPAQKRVRPRRHSAESVARAIVRMAGSRRRGMVLSFEAKLLCLANIVAPGLVDRFLGRTLNRS